MIRAAWHGANDAAGESLESDQRFLRLSGLVQFGQMSQQFFLIGHAAEVPADHLVGPQRGLLSGSQADHARDDPTIGLQFDAGLRMSRLMAATEQVLEEPKQDFNLQAIVIQQRNDVGRTVQ